MSGASSLRPQLSGHQFVEAVIASATLAARGVRVNGRKAKFGGI